jgi:type IV pilus assembly protein PilA
MSPQRRTGFTLIELLIVVVIIGILAAIAVPKFANSKGKAYAASLKSDLHNLATAQEAYFYDHYTYTTDLNSLKYQISPGVQIVVDEATRAGWLARRRARAGSRRRRTSRRTRSPARSSSAR